ncbi:hypothetical protein [Micromonospora orduensis]|uniref:hypothetical protein n=1 Tax=Micromonospora orduensis TaxID=1420891 RepID=UPI0033E2E6F6
MSYRHLPSFEQKAVEAKAAADAHRRESEGHEIWESTTSWFCDDCDAVYPPKVKPSTARHPG